MPVLTWALASCNQKTGSIPTAWVGESIGEARETCKGCSLLESGQCYAWAGNVQRGFNSILRARKKRPDRYTLESVLSRRGWRTKYVRFGALGDPGRCTRKAVLCDVARCRREGLGVLAYTHFWRGARQASLRSDFRASCDNANEAVEARAAGWAVAVVLPWDHPGKTFRLPDGAKGRVCPAQLRDITCNQCGLCDAAGKHRETPVGFLDHGPRANGKRRRKAVK